jgi:hypothetical protein
MPGLGAQYLLSGAERVTSGLQLEVLSSSSAGRYRIKAGMTEKEAAA